MMTSLWLAGPSRRRAGGVGLMLAVLAGAGAMERSAHAWDAASTHAGLTEQAALASTLGRLLTEMYGHRLGLYEPLRLQIAGARGERIGRAILRFAQTEGYAPSSGRLPALGWLIAGSVLEEIPLERVEHHYFDPSTGRGLPPETWLSRLDLQFGAVASGAAPSRTLLTGGNPSGGHSAVEWLTAKDNDLGLEHYLDARERAAAAATVEQRSAALAEALLISGALVHVIEDAAEPALVRGDFRIEFAEHGGPLRRWVAERYGRLGIPAPGGEPVAVEHLSELITNEEKTGLADRTATRFFSSGTLPDRSPARAPTVSAGPGAAGYVSTADAAHLAAWRRSDGRVAWQLDERCYADMARVLLPEAGRYALSALEHLWRGRIILSDDDVRVGSFPLGEGKLSFYAEDDRGNRRLVESRMVGAAAAEESFGRAPPSAAGSRRLIVVFRGVDEGDDPIVVSAERLLE